MTASTIDLPVSITSAGAQPTPAATLQAAVLSYALSLQPGLTVNLPGLMLEDVLSVLTAGLVQIDAARVDTLNDVSPNVANVALLTQLGNVQGVTQVGPANTSVPVVFSGTAGYVVPAGELVGDGTYTYQVQGGGPILATGGASGDNSSAVMTAIAIVAGSWSVAEGTVTQVQSNIPPTVTLSVTNLSAGTPGSTTGETYYSYRTRINNANNAASVGTPSFIKTQVMQQCGLTASQVSVQQGSPGIRVIVVGGQVQQVAYAIFTGVADVSQLIGSAINSDRNVTTSLIDYPNTYSVLSVASPQQTFSAVATWNTTLSSFTGGGAFQGLVQAPIAAYINSLAPGQVINLLEMNNIFQTAIAGVLNPTLLTRLVWSIDINGTPVSPGSGESYIAGDAESYFYCTSSDITVTQG